MPASLQNQVTRAGLNSTGHFWELSWAHAGQHMPCTAASALASLGPGRISTRSLLRVLKKSLFATNCCCRDTPALKRAESATTILLAVPKQLPGGSIQPLPPWLDAIQQPRGLCSTKPRSLDHNVVLGEFVLMGYWHPTRPADKGRLQEGEAEAK